jgi:hypothetical protein
MKINVVYRNIKINLMNYLPLLKEGYTTLVDISNVFTIYEYLYNEKLSIIYRTSYKKKKDLADDKNIKICEIIIENDLISSLYKHYTKFEFDENDNIMLESFLTNMNGNNMIDYEWITLLISSKLGLYICIILDYEFIVEELLIDIDPRDHNNEAYHLSVKMGNDRIINMIKNKIIELNWLDKEVLIKEFGKYDFLSTDIVKHYQSMKY